MSASMSPPSEAGLRPWDHSHWILRRLRQDHKASLACIDLLQNLSRDPSGSSLVSRLIDELIDSPDDIHHYVERRLYRRLWYRLGVFLPSCFDLDEWHEERRDRRLALVRRLEEGGDAWPRTQEALATLDGLCNCVRAQIADEERRFFPLVESRLSANDWANVEDEVAAYDEAWRSLSSPPGARGATVPFAGRA